MKPQSDLTILALAAVAAFGASLLAISEHVRSMEAGYSLGASRREHAVLHREAIQAERKLAGARSPAAVSARAKAWNLGMDYYASAPSLPPSAFVPTPAVASGAPVVAVAPGTPSASGARR